MPGFYPITFSEGGGIESRLPFKIFSTLEISLFPGRFPEWENLFDAFEKYGTIENMMEVYFEIQRLAALHHKILFTVEFVKKRVAKSPKKLFTLADIPQ